MGLQVEADRRAGYRSLPSGDYGDATRRVWPRTNRVELNAMTTPQLLEWLDEEMEPHAGEAVPPAEVTVERLRAEARAELERRITEEVLREAGLDDLVAAGLAAREGEILAPSSTITEDVEPGLTASPAGPWSTPVRRMGREIAREGGAGATRNAASPRPGRIAGGPPSRPGLEPGLGVRAAARAADCTEGTF